MTWIYIWYSDIETGQKGQVWVVQQGVTLKMRESDDFFGLVEQTRSWGRKCLFDESVQLSISQFGQQLPH